MNKVASYSNVKLPETLSVYRSRFGALPSIGSAIFAEHTVKRLNNATENGHIYTLGFVDDCYGLGCDFLRTDGQTQGHSIYRQSIASRGKNIKCTQYIALSRWPVHAALQQQQQQQL